MLPFTEKFIQKVAYFSISLQSSPTIHSIHWNGFHAGHKQPSLCHCPYIAASWLKLSLLRALLLSLWNGLGCCPFLTNPNCKLCWCHEPDRLPVSSIFLFLAQIGFCCFEPNSNSCTSIFLFPVDFYSGNPIVQRTAQSSFMILLSFNCYTVLLRTYLCSFYDWQTSFIVIYFLRVNHSFI